jgi:hypothetical protein
MTVFGFDVTTLLFLALAIFAIVRMVSVLRGKGRQMATASPIRSAVPDEIGNEPLLLHCPSQGGWHVGVWHDGKWLDHATRTVELHPDFYMDPPPPLDERGKLSRPWGSSLPEKIRNVALWIIIFLLVLALVTLFQNPAHHPVR